MLGRSRDRGKLHRRDTQAAVAAQHPLSADTRAVSSERGGLAGACGKWLSSKHLDAESDTQRPAAPPPATGYTQSPARAGRSRLLVFRLAGATSPLSL